MIFFYIINAFLNSKSILLAADTNIAIKQNHGNYQVQSMINYRELN
jgi:hypothetical protein